MINRVKGKVNHAGKKVNLASWEDVIADIGRQIKDGKQRLAGLKMVERSFQRLRDSGQPFHGDSATHS